jgi:hypothetical protein
VTNVPEANHFTQEDGPESFAKVIRSLSKKIWSKSLPLICRNSGRLGLWGNQPSPIPPTGSKAEVPTHARQFVIHFLLFVSFERFTYA